MIVCHRNLLKGFCPVAVAATTYLLIKDGFIWRGCVHASSRFELGRGRSVHASCAEHIPESSIYHPPLYSVLLGTLGCSGRRLHQKPRHFKNTAPRQPTNDNKCNSIVSSVSGTQNIVPQSSTLRFSYLSTWSTCMFVCLGSPSPFLHLL